RSYSCFKKIRRTCGRHGRLYNGGSAISATRESAKSADESGLRRSRADRGWRGCLDRDEIFPRRLRIQHIERKDRRGWLIRLRFGLTGRCARFLLTVIGDNKRALFAFS